MFEPEQSSLFISTAGNNLVNCLPHKNGWGPMPSFTEVSEALPTECLGAVFVFLASGAVKVFAGTATNLYRLNAGSYPYTWDEISKVTDTYAVPSGGRWDFELFGQNLIAANGGGVLQFVDVETSNDFADIAGSPNCKYVFSSGDFLIAANISGATSTIQWSGLNDSSFWTNGQRGADQQAFPSGGVIQGGIADRRGAVIFQRDRMQYLQFAPGSGYTFTTSEANTRRGVVSPLSIVQIGPEQFMYLSEDGFFSGVEGKPIGAERVDRWFFDEVDQTYLSEVRGMADPFDKIVWWRFKATDGMNKLLGYDWQLDRWCYSDQQITEAAKVALPGTTWDGLDNLYATIDAATESFDSALYKAGKPVFGGFTTNNKLAVATGVNKAVEIETGFLELNEGKRAFITGGHVQTDADTFTVSVGVKDYHSDDTTYKSAVSPSSRTKQLPLRADGRLHSFKLNIAAGENWEVANAIQIEANGSGKL